MSNWWDKYVGYYLGDQEDRESLITESSPVPTFANTYATPEEVDPRIIFPDHPWSESQLSQGACAGHMRANIQEWIEAIATQDKPPQLSRQMAYISGQEVDGLKGRDVGATIRGQVTVAYQKGTCLESLWRYTGKYHTNPPGKTWAEIWEDAANHKIAKYSVMRTYDDVFNWLAMGVGGVGIGIRWSLPSAAVIESYSPGGGGHAVSLLGYTKRKDRNGRNYILLLNSWGTQWGNRGWAEISPTAITQMLSHTSYNIMIGMSDMQNMTPRNVDFTKGAFANAISKAKEKLGSLAL